MWVILLYEMPGTPHCCGVEHVKEHVGLQGEGILVRGRLKAPLQRRNTSISEYRVVESFRDALLGEPVSYGPLAVAAAVSIVALPLAYLYFKHVESTVADVL